MPAKSTKVDTWMPIYIGDYLADTAHLTTEEHGAYLLLMFHYWRKGPLPNIPRSLGAIAKTPADKWAELWQGLASFFQLGEDGMFHHKRIDSELDKASSRARRGSDGAAGRWGEGSDDNKAKRSERLAAARQKGTHTVEQWLGLLNVCGNACLKCGQISELVKDHIIPIYRGGSDGLDNIQPLCRACNASKGPDTTDFRPSGWQNACETPARAVPNDWSSPSPSPSPKKKQKPSGEKPPADVRHTPFRLAIVEAWPEGEPDWNGREGSALGKLLAANPKLSLDGFRRILKHRRESEGVNLHERPCVWLEHVKKYAGGPLDRYGKPLQSAKPSIPQLRGVTLEEAMQR